MRRSIPLLVLALCVTTAGCYASGSATVTASSPGASLVLISPGVYVVEDYDYPVFWYDNYYWRYDGGVWYRSTYWDTGFVVVSTNVVPRPIVVIDRPRRYVRYRGRRGARRRAIRRTRRNIRRDRRQQRRDYRRDRRQQRRDNRQQRRDNRQKRRRR